MYHHHHHHHASRHSFFEVSSSFYTNNPLLYVSHYSEIIVSTGYDAKQHPGMLNQTLSARRELVELLDSEPLFDYLLQNGAVKPSVIEDIKEEKSQVQVRKFINLQK